ncbi:hypothetical protein HB884_05885 [Listeria booriae]|uniref:Uncharacterized protein n=1 Tax=Listeria booriae TaxID=1552123 RepID=A0A7X0XCH9_9LIST|nr:hypothetical protein [Listeria booriae]MBC1491398.1 hypothetical protein [Listeria booriae]MBC1523735.1 hypothetical protein [Listeria booriae]MBC6150111.1 hypothetical protein [Listeria booriae]
MPYVDFNFYTNTYFGEEVENSDFARLEARARDKIDELTYYRVQRRGLSKYNDFIQLQVKKAVCAQIEYFIEMGGTSASAINSPLNFDTVSIGRTSVKSNGLNTNSSAGGRVDKNMYSPDAIKYLEITGLLYAGVGVFR